MKLLDQFLSDSINYFKKTSSLQGDERELMMKTLKRIQNKENENINKAREYFKEYLSNKDFSLDAGFIENMCSYAKHVMIIPIEKIAKLRTAIDESKLHGLKASIKMFSTQEVIREYILRKLENASPTTEKVHIVLQSAPQGQHYL